MAQPVFFCKLCGIELDEHDVDANLCTWEEFRLYCSDCIAEVDDAPYKPSPVVYNGRVIWPS